MDFQRRRRNRSAGSQSVDLGASSRGNAPRVVPRAVRGRILRALAEALPVFFSARLFAVVAVPLAAAALGWLFIGWWAWEPLADWLAGFSLFGEDRSGGLGHRATQFGAALLAVALLMLAAAVTALVAIAVLAMPVIVELVATRDFATLARRRGGSFAGSAANAVVTVAIYVLLWLVALFLLLVPPLYVAATLLLNAWLNQRLFRYDALALHADRAEMREVVRQARSRMFLLGLLLAPLSLVPLVNLVAPLYAGIAFTYLCLSELTALRASARQ